MAGPASGAASGAMMSAAPWWYEMLWRIALPFALVRLWLRGRREPGYRLHVGERLGRYGQGAPSGKRDPIIWIHAVSVGETRAAQPLIGALARAHPDSTVVVTHMTAAGRETGRALFGERIVQVYLPYDYSTAVESFLERFHPRFGVLMETELWPNLILRSRARGIPVFLVNARLSQRSADRYARLPGLARVTLQSLAGVSAQASHDATRLEALGAPDVHVAGNIKFDLDVPGDTRDNARALRERFGATRPVWIAGSTRDGEEAILIEALRKGDLPRDALLVLVPRHPQRFDDVAKLVEASGLPFVRRSSTAPVTSEVAIVVGDSMGEMLAYYGAADVAFVGGTLLPLGGQNLIEPLAVATPVVIGPSTHNFAEIVRVATECGAAEQVGDAASLMATIGGLLRDPDRRARMAAAGTALLAAHRGATARTTTWLAARFARASSVNPARD